MKKVDILRKKYPRFVYENYYWRITNGNLNISFNFLVESAEALGEGGKIEPSISFNPKIVIQNVDRNQIKKVGDRVLNNLVFNLGLIELISYWKATCSPIIEIRAGFLNKEQVWWLKDLIINGMGQFFYENKINWKTPYFLKIASKVVENSSLPTFSPSFREEILVPIGGGKDSMVTLEILKKAKKKIKCFSLNPTEVTKRIMKIGKCQNPILINRKIDPKLLELNQSGFLNGHTPFTAYLSFLSVFLAVIFEQKYIAFSNERSSNEGNVKYLGKIINHQYSKSFDFEQKFRKYSKKYLAKNIEYFSFLRPLYEIQIARLFSRYPKYFDAFLSCNEAFKTYSGTKLPIKKWCGNCPKCLFIFAILYPFIEEKKLVKIFGKNLFEKKELLNLMKELIGESKFKPFECVGTKRESLVVFYLALRSFRRRGVKLPSLLSYFEEKILPKYPNLEREAKKILNSWLNQHHLTKELEKILLKSIYRFRKSIY